MAYNYTSWDALLYKSKSGGYRIKASAARKGATMKGAMAALGAAPAKYNGKISGYKVIFVPFANGRPSGESEDILTGFVNTEAEVAYGRPVGVVVDRADALLVADDVGNVIWRVTPSSVKVSGT